ncbi:MAG: aspartate aminotransferase family protein [Candidatus Omnitrophica bacterium CG11_big_fil_rev_8_21_14_0_20_63_9]|nr:MAG: aspartate aminotransferase family protein [Candidatus Omnitrophica bacterium CG11_big_fil_rev_8_21_14_0_20_63_9]
MASTTVMPRRRAPRGLVGGVNSPVRAFRHVGAEPLLLETAKGVIVTDRNGRRLTDFIMGWGAIILGHNPAPVVRALRERTRRGVLLGLTHQGEFELASRIIRAVPSVQQVRFTVSGSEACLIAARLARAHTKREKILLFDGCYHGHGDSLIVGHSAGLPRALESQVATVPFNHLERLEDVLRREGEHIAAILVEPVPANMGVVLPAEGFLRQLRELTRRYGIVLIFDEVVTGFRLGRAGAQGYFGVTPDLTTFGKIIGGGLPIGAVGGPERLMSLLAPEGPVYHGGTFAGHPLSMAAGCAVLDLLEAEPPYAALQRRLARLQKGLEQAAARAGVPLRVSAIGSMATAFFSSRARFAEWANALRRAGILVPPSPFEAMFLSSAHRDSDIDRLISATAQSLRTMAGQP